MSSRIRGFASVMLLLLGAIPHGARADEPTADDKPAEKRGFEFVMEKQIPSASVKNQAQTGTCWSFATISFLEAEAMRLGHAETDLSEMFAVRHTFPQKAEQFIRWHGTKNFGSGSLAPDALRILDRFGCVPESVYSGKPWGQTRHDHGELDGILRGMLDAVLANRGKTLSPVWPKAVEAVLDTYLGPPPTEFVLDGTKYTPKSFAEKLGLSAANYIHFTSFTHHPMYAECVLEVPDNWAGNKFWNIPLPEFMHVLDRALELGYTVAWDGDVSEPSFKHDKGIAILPEKDWEDRSKKERESICEGPEAEMRVTKEIRQRSFENYSSTDDHLMHAVGVARDQNGTRYYLIKNSWGEADSEHKGYLHMSEAYARCKTLAITVHRDALPEELRAKLHDGSRVARP